MTTYYISPNGSDSNNGLGPDASHATNKPWLTLGKALNTGSAISNASANTLYVAPGYYYSAACTPIATVSSVANPLQIIGDPKNEQGFKDGSGVRLAPGIPWFTTRTAAEGIDGTLATNSPNQVLFTCTTNKPSGLQFKKLMLECTYNGQGSAAIIVQDLATGTDNFFEECILWAPYILKYSGGAPTAGRNHTLRRCIVFATQDVVFLQTTTAAATADADLTILMEECWGYGAWAGGALQIGASGGNIGGGIRFYDNTWLGRGTNNLTTTALRVSTVTPVRFGGNLIISGGNGAAANAGTSGAIIDDGYNRQWNGGANTNVTLAGTSLIGVAPNLNFPMLLSWGLIAQLGPLLGWTDAAHASQKFSAYSRTTPDFFGRTVRPWGAGSSIGCFQNVDVAHDTASAISTGGTDSLKLTGAGEVSIFAPVDAAATTITIATKSTSYGGANYPQLIVVPNPSIGVTEQTATASSASEQTISAGPFTPTAKGVVEIRLISRSSSGGSSTYFDSLAA